MFFLNLVLAFVFASVNAQENIENFSSDIRIHVDGSMQVHETITVHATGDQIKRGIVREFPTSYRDRYGNNYVVGFTVDSVNMAGAPVEYRVEPYVNGKKIYIGSRDVFLAPGNYTYDITYTTNRQLGFFKDYDELYWNVTGNGWRLPIRKAHARISFDFAINTQQLTHEAYTGYAGEQGKTYTSSVQNDSVFFSTTTPLAQKQGLTIVVTWPKGLVHEPTWWQRMVWLFKDNLHILILLIANIGLFGVFLYFYFAHRAERKKFTVIPLFYPPEVMLPGAMRYFTKMSHDGVALAADIVNMAVNGWLTIDQKAGFFSSTYVLGKKEKQAQPALYETIYNLLFASGNSFAVDSSTLHPRNTLNLMSNHHAQVCQKEYGKYFKFPYAFLIIASVLMASAVVNPWFLGSAFDSRVWILFYVLLGLQEFIGMWLLRSYTKEGLALKAQIDGFKMFLSATETERLKLIGTPPTQTPQLYEQYLPYAIALGIEKAWTNQFATVFKNLEQAGRPYRPIWFVGPHFNITNIGSFGRSFGSAIAASSTPPGSSSGRGGGGRSGGGGGGGGGGGW